MTSGARFVGLAVCVLLLLGCQARPAAPWAEGTPLPTRVRLDVKGRVQARSLSCESRSACDVLAWWGRDVSEAVFFEGLARSDNPEHGFVGSVDDPGGGLPPAGYGVYEEPVAARLRDFGARTQAVRDADLEGLRRQIAQRRPVLVWATAGLDAPEPRHLVDGEGRGFVAVPYEHTFLAVGYTPGRIVLLDPATGRTREVAYGTFDRSWATLGRRAVTVDGVDCPSR